LRIFLKHKDESLGRTSMKRLALILTAVASSWTLAAAAEPAPQAVLSASDFNGVWAPEMRRPGGPGGPGGGGPPPGGPRGFGPPGFGPRGGPGGPIEISAEDQAKGLDQGDIRTRSQMTEAGKAKFATFDPLEHPASNCQTPGLPSIAMIPELQQWTIAPAAVTIRHESFATVRTVYLDQGSHPGAAHTALGHAYGALANPKGVPELVIETGNLSAEWGGLGRNAPGSDQRTVRESYRLIDKDTIEGVIEVTDPLYLTQPLRMPVRLHRQPAGTEIVDFPCDVEVSKRDYQYIQDGASKN
jgi:hypothetical protein